MDSCSIQNFFFTDASYFYLEYWGIFYFHSIYYLENELFLLDRRKKRRGQYFAGREFNC